MTHVLLASRVPAGPLGVPDLSLSLEEWGEVLHVPGCWATVDTCSDVVLDFLSLYRFERCRLCLSDPRSLLSSSEREYLDVMMRLTMHQPRRRSRSKLPSWAATASDFLHLLDFSRVDTSGVPALQEYQERVCELERRRLERDLRLLRLLPERPLRMLFAAAMVERVYPGTFDLSDLPALERRLTLSLPLSLLRISRPWSLLERFVTADRFPGVTVVGPDRSPECRTEDLNLLRIAHLRWGSPSSCWSPELLEVPVLVEQALHPVASRVCAGPVDPGAAEVFLGLWEEGSSAPDLLEAARAL